MTSLLLVLVSSKTPLGARATLQAVSPRGPSFLHAPQRTGSINSPNAETMSGGSCLHLKLLLTTYSYIQ